MITPIAGTSIIVGRRRAREVMVQRPSGAVALATARKLERLGWRVEIVIGPPTSTQRLTEHIRRSKAVTFSDLLGLDRIWRDRTAHVDLKSDRREDPGSINLCSLGVGVDLKNDRSR